MNENNNGRCRHEKVSLRFLDEVSEHGSVVSGIGASFCDNCGDMVGLNYVELPVTSGFMLVVVNADLNPETGNMETEVLSTVWMVTAPRLVPKRGSDLALTIPTGPRGKYKRGGKK